MVKNDRNHGAGKGSPGAIWGSKKLKAIAVRGTGNVPVAEPAAFVETAVQLEANLFEPIEPGVLPLVALWHNGGMTRNHGAMSSRGMTAGKNLTDQAWSRRFSEKYVGSLRGLARRSAALVQLFHRLCLRRADHGRPLRRIPREPLRRRRAV